MDVGAVEAPTIRRSQTCKRLRQSVSTSQSRFFKSTELTRQVATAPEKWVVMIRPSLIRDYEAAGVKPNADDAWSWSMWRGYLESEDGTRIQQWFTAAGARAAHLHTSGHASPRDLRAFTLTIRPKWLVPIHGVAWDGDADGFPPIRRLSDGEPLAL